MGYQESLLHIKPQKNVEVAIDACMRAKEAGYYNALGAMPVAVITLKKSIGRYLAGAQLIWITGDRGFHTPDGIFGPEFKSLPRLTQFEINPIETFVDSLNGFDEGITFNGNTPTENTWFRYESIVVYNQTRQEKEVSKVKNAGYEILDWVIFEDNRGFALGNHPKAPSPYVTWQFNEEEDGTRNYNTGHYLTDEFGARKDFNNRIIHRVIDYKLRCFNSRGDEMKFKSEDLLPDFCYSVLPGEEKLILIKHGEGGYYHCDFSTNDPDVNRQIAYKQNDALGVSSAQAEAMLIGSMSGWNVPGADPRNYRFDGTPIKPKKENKSQDRER